MTSTKVTLDLDTRQPREPTSDAGVFPHDSLVSGYSLDALPDRTVLSMTASPVSHQVTALLQEVDDRPHAAAELLPLVYPQLRAAAQKRMSSERDDHTLQPTALVHEAFLKLVEDRDLPWQNRRHFYAAAADAMRQILIDHARAKSREKRGGERRRVELQNLAHLADADGGEILRFDEVFDKLSKELPDAAEVVRLRFYGGLGVEGTAKALAISTSTVDRRWSLARAWMFRALEQTETDAAS